MMASFTQTTRILQFYCFLMLITNELSKKKCEPDEEAVYRALRSLKVMHKKSQVSQLDFGVNDFRCVSEI